MMNTRFLLFLIAYLTAMATAFAPLPQTRNAASPLSAIPGSIFEDPGAWFKHKQEVMSDKREITLHHILIANDLNQKYNPAGYVSDAMTKLEEIKESINNGEEDGKILDAFEAAAKEHSLDKTSASNGGFLGKFKRGKLEISVDDAAFNGEVGKVIGPVKSFYGLHLLLVSDRA